MAERDYSRLVLIGKSLGAALVGLLCLQMTLPEWTRAVYLTPPLGSMFNPTFLDTKQPSCIALGTQDRYFDVKALRDLEEAKDFKLIKVENADHSMNVKYDLKASLNALHVVVEEVVTFITLGD
jgi:hypothetical protein